MASTVRAQHRSVSKLGVLELVDPAPDKWRLWIVILMIVKYSGFFLFEGAQVKATIVVLLAALISISVQHQRCGLARSLGADRILLPCLITWLWCVRMPLIQDLNLHVWLTALVTIIKDVHTCSRSHRLRKRKASLVQRFLVLTRRRRYG